MSHQSSTQPPVEGVAPPNEEQLTMHRTTGESLAAGDRTGPSMQGWRAHRWYTVPPVVGEIRHSDKVGEYAFLSKTARVIVGDKLITLRNHHSAITALQEGIAEKDREIAQLKELVTKMVPHLTQGMQQTMNHQSSTETTGLSVRKPGTPPPASGRADIAGCSVLHFAGDSTVIVHGPSGFVTMTPDNQRADLPSRLLCELALAVLANRPDFEAVKDKRMGELTPAQQDDAREQWLRKQISDIGRSSHDLESHIVFLLKRLDAARGVVAKP